MYLTRTESISPSREKNIFGVEDVLDVISVAGRVRGEVVVECRADGGIIGGRLTRRLSR